MADAIPLNRGTSPQPFQLKKAETSQAEPMRLPQNDINIKSLKRGSMLLNGSPKVSEEQITKTAEDFEAVFISQMLKHAFEGQKPNEVMGGGSSEEIYNDMMIDEYGKLIARTGGVGLADTVKQHMINLQEVEK